MKPRHTILLAFATALLLTILVGCSQSASVVSESDAKDAVNSLTYQKDARTKLCFGIVASRHVAEVSQNGLTITYVPCTPEVEAQIAGR
jgi:hypothetical protein